MQNSIARPSCYGLFLASLAAFSINAACVNSVTQNRQMVAEITKKPTPGTNMRDLKTNNQSPEEDRADEAEVESRANCVYTGVIKVVRKGHAQPVIKIENICAEDGGNFLKLSPGEHKEVQSNNVGHFPLPFRDSHIVLDGGVPYLVYQNEGQTHKTEIQHIMGDYYTFEMIAISELRPILDDSWLDESQ
ncbi:MAG: hypothetical protein V1880_01345 [Patescibacteria group bacterium]